MTAAVARRAGILLVPGAAAGCLARGTGTPRYPMQRHGPDRTAMPYDEPWAEDKRALFDRINLDRVAHGVAPVGYEPRAAQAGDRFCLDAFAGRPLKGWRVGVVEIRFEPPPRPLTLLQVRRRHAYSYPEVIRSFVPTVSGFMGPATAAMVTALP